MPLLLPSTSHSKDVDIIGRFGDAGIRYVWATAELSGHSNPSTPASPLGTASRSIQPSPVPPPRHQHHVHLSRAAPNTFACCLSGMGATEVPKSPLIKIILTDTEMTAVLPYDFWRGEGLHFHRQTVGPLSRYGFLHLLLPMLHADESLSFERRNDSASGKDAFTQHTLTPSLREMKSTNETCWSLSRSPSANRRVMPSGQLPASPRDVKQRTGDRSISHNDKGQDF